MKARWTRHFFPLLLLIGWPMMVKGSALVAGSQPGHPPLKPPKVSELNANLFSALYDAFQKVGHHVCEGFISLKDFVTVGEWVFESLKTPALRGEVGSFCLRLAIPLILAFALAQGLSFWLKPKIHDLLRCKEKAFSQKLLRLLKATALSTVAPLVFGFSLYAFARLISPQNQLCLEAARILSSGAFIIWSLLNSANLFLRPLTPEHQHIPLSSKSLINAYRWIRRMAIVALLGFFAFETGILICLPSSGEKLLLQGSSFIIALLAACMMGGLHPEITAWIQGQHQKLRLSPLRKAMLFYLQYSYVPALLFIVITYISWLTPESDAFQRLVWKTLLALSLFAFARLLSYYLRRLRLLYGQRHLHRWTRSLTRNTLFYTRKFELITWLILNGGVLLLILDMCGFNLSSLVFSHMGSIIVQKVFSFFSIVIVSVLIIRLLNRLLTRYLRVTEGSGTEANKQRIARFKTISSVTRNVVRIVVWTPAFLLIAVEMDIDIVPLLAPATLLAVGISLGAQSLVKDIFTGFFMLLEDAFAVDDWMVINGVEGRVESLTVRVVRLRAGNDGSLHTVPYGNITSLSNHSREFSAAGIGFTVGIAADIDQVFEIVEKISKEMRKTPAIRKLLLGSVEIGGVDKINDHSLEIKVSFKTKPSEHYKVRRAFNKLLKQYLESENIPTSTPRLLSYNYPIEK